MPAPPDHPANPRLPRAIAALPALEVARRLDAGHAVLWPMGSTETHGPALPMGDFLLAEAIAQRIADAAGDALVLPALPFGGADFFAGVPGAVALSHATLAAVIREGLESLLAGGARRILLVNGHGGSVPPIEEAQRHAQSRHGAVVPALHLWRNAGAWQAELGGDPAALGHGGDPIASVTRHLFPERCDAAALAPRDAAPGTLWGIPVSGFGTLRHGGAEFGVPVGIEAIAPGGTQAADPRGASAAHGARIVARLVEAGAALLAAMREGA